MNIVFQKCLNGKIDETIIARNEIDSFFIDQGFKRKTHWLTGKEKVRLLRGEYYPTFENLKGPGISDNKVCYSLPRETTKLTLYRFNARGDNKKKKQETRKRIYNSKKNNSKHSYQLFFRWLENGELKEQSIKLNKIKTFFARKGHKENQLYSTRFIKGEYYPKFENISGPCIGDNIIYYCPKDQFFRIQKRTDKVRKQRRETYQQKSAGNWRILLKIS